MKKKAEQSVAFLLVMAGCGGMLFDFGGTIINPAIPYLESLKAYTTAELSHLTSAVVMSAAFAGLAAGWLAERLGRKPVMLIAAALAALACLPICLVEGYRWFYLGRILQGVAAGLIGVVVPMYLAESLDAANRGKGAGVFQFMDVIGILFCSLVGVGVVNALGGPNDPSVSAATKAAAWKTVFWTSAVPALVFFLGALGLRESPVWMEEGREKRERGTGNGMGVSCAAKATSPRAPSPSPAAAPKDSLFQKKYVLPFALSLAILACNQATGCNSIQYFALKMFMDAGLGDAVANYANVALWAVMLATTAVACTLVDRKGRKFLLNIGTLGMVVADALAGCVFLALAKGWLARGRRHRPLHRGVLDRAGRRRVARALGADAEPHPRERHGRRPVRQHDGRLSHLGRLPAARREVGLRARAVHARRFRARLFPRGGPVPAGDERQDAGGDRSAFWR